MLLVQISGLIGNVDLVEPCRKNFVYFSIAQKFLSYSNTILLLLLV